MSIIVEGLTKVFGSQKAVNKISFTINKGEVVGFLGPNGAGKSTTIKMITGFLPQDDGAVSVCGLNVADHPLEIKRKIGYLPEANPLYFDMYVKEYLGFIAGVHKVPQASQKIKEVIALTGLGVEQHKKISQLSKGYKQRVGLAASLIHEPEVLILDEPTSGLDPNQIIEIRNVIKEQGKNKTVLFSSHILQEVEAICNRVIIINKGQIVADDLLANLKRNTGSNRVIITFKEVAGKELMQAFNAVSELETTDGFTWQLTTSDEAATRKQLLEMALRENLNITALQTETNNLESVFRSLTN